MVYFAYKPWVWAVGGALALHALALLVLQAGIARPAAPQPTLLAVGRMLEPPPTPKADAAPPPAPAPTPSTQTPSPSTPTPPPARKQPSPPTATAAAVQGASVAPQPSTATEGATESPANPPQPSPAVAAATDGPADTSAARAPTASATARKSTPAYAQHQPAPVITPLMSRMGQDVGDVSLQLLIGKNGAVLEVRELKMSEHERLNQAVLAAAKRSRFVPAQCDGEPVTSWWNITYRVGPDTAQSAAREASGAIDCSRLPPQ